jgi:hypothetical protein
MDYFAGLDISMDETHICVLDREGVVVYESKTASRPRRSLTNWRKRQVSSHRIRDQANGADPVSRVEPTRFARSLREEPAGLPGAQVDGDPTKPIAMTREGWRIWLALVSSSRCM